MEPTDPDIIELPPVNAVSLAVGHLIRTLEERVPGITESWLDSLRDEAAWTEVTRLRGPRHGPAIRREYAKAVAWGERVRLLTIAFKREEPAVAEDPKPWWWFGRHRI